MALSSDEIIKREIIEKIGYEIGNLKIRIFPESSNDDQKLFEDGGLTFSYDGADYGSCDAGWFNTLTGAPVVALEGTDALNRRSGGNAQLQRFHHALGAVKSGLIGVYYLKKGNEKIRPDLFGMAYFASNIEKGNYIIIDDLDDLRDLLISYSDKDKLKAFLDEHLSQMYDKFKEDFDDKYNGHWETFAKKRSTIIKDGYVIKHAGRMKRNFTDSSQRAGHIAVGEMYLTKYFFYDKKFYYLFPKMTAADLLYLDQNKSNDKEWYLLRNEPNVEIKTVDHIKGISDSTKNILYGIKDDPLKGDIMRVYTKCVNEIVIGLEKGSMMII